jgi:hypothetical protein
LNFGQTILGFGLADSMSATAASDILQ